jgi:LPXTG-motif cell wall-anchored protein
LVSGAALIGAGAAVASAEQVDQHAGVPETTTTTVAPTTTTTAVAPTTATTGPQGIAVLPQQAARPPAAAAPAQGLPVTGSDVVGLGIIGAAGVGAGVALVLAGRRRAGANS